MKNVLNRWWQRRRAKHYLNNHWHLFADSLLLLIILGLLVTLIIVQHTPKPVVDTSAVSHVPQDTTPNTNDILIIKPLVDKKNIYSGQAFTVNISLENQGRSDLPIVELIPKITTSEFTLSKITSRQPSANITITGNKIIIDKLAAGDAKELELLVSIKAKDKTVRKISWSLEAAYKYNGRDLKTSTALPDLKLISDIKIKAAAYYNSQLGDQLGSGPIPPVVGLPTNYWIFFTADEGNNDFSNLTVSGRLAQGVTLSNHKTLSAGEFSYNESQKRITWTVKKIETDNGNYQVGFDIQLLPTDKQLGTNPVLVDNISYLATDAYTGEKISGKLPVITTELLSDLINQGQGKVIK